MGPVLAFRLAGYAWDDGAIRVSVADDGAPNSLEACEASDGWSGCCEETLPAGYCRDGAVAAMDVWNDGVCGPVWLEYGGVCRNEPDPDDGIGCVSFNDPRHEILEVGTLAVAVMVQASGNAAVDIVFNDAVDFLAPDEPCDPQGDAFSYEAVLMHELGHVLGLGHLCEDPNKDPPCSEEDADLTADSVMNASGCEPPTELGTVDVDQYRELHGEHVEFDCVPEEIGSVPFDVHCAATSNATNEITSVRWTFGDGGTDEGLATSHTYREQGVYTVAVEATGVDAECGEWTDRYEVRNVVTACEVPQPVFSVERIGKLRYRMLNDTDPDVPACFSNVAWNVHRGGIDGAVVLGPLGTWEPEIVFPEPGKYTVVLNLGGVAGTGAAAVTFHARKGCGCESSPPAGAEIAVLIAVVGSRRRNGLPWRRCAPLRHSPR